MSITVKCPECSAILLISEQAEGERIRCPHCQAALRFPGQSDAASLTNTAGSNPPAAPPSASPATHPADARTPQEVAKTRADNLNNQAVVLLSLGKPPGAEQLFEKVLRIAPNHPQATYNRGLLHWRTGRLTDLGLVRQLEELRGAIPDDWHAPYCLGLVHVERGDIPAAVEQLAEASKRGGSKDAEALMQRVAPLADRGARCTGVLEGHVGAVRAVCVSDDGSQAVSGSADGILRLWDLADRACLQTIPTGSEPIAGVALAPDGRWAISAGQSVALWDLADGRCLRSFAGHTGRVTSLSLRSDAAQALTGSEDRTVRLWDIETGECLRVFEGHTATITCVCLSLDGRFAISGSAAQELWTWDTASGNRIRAFEIQEFGPECVSVSRDARWVLSGDADAKLHLWSTKNGMRVRTLRGHTRKVTSAGLSANGQWALSSSLDGTLRVWDVTTGCCVRTLEGHRTGVVSVGMSADGARAVSADGGSDPTSDAASDSSTLRLWDLAIFHRPEGRFKAPPARCVIAGKEEAKPGQGRFQGMLTQAQSLADAERFEESLYLIEQARKIPSFGLNAQAIDLRSRVGQHGSRDRFRDGRCTRMIRCPGSGVGAVALSPDASHALSTGPDKMVRLWNLAKGESEGVLTGHTAPVNDVCYLPDGRRALSASEDGTLRLWDLASATCLRTFEGHASWVSGVAASPDGRWALSGSRDKTLRLWDIGTGACLRTFAEHTNLVRAVGFSACGRFVLSGSFDKTLRLWDVATGQCLRVFEGHADIIHSACLSWDRRWALSASNDKTFRVWDVASGRCVRVFQDHFERVLSVAVTGDGGWALSGSGDKMLRLWHLTTGQCAQVLSGHTGVVTSLAMSADGRWAVSGSHDRTLRVWEIEWDYDFPAHADWDDAALPHLENFLTLHTPYQADPPAADKASDETIAQALTRSGTPSWSEEDFQGLYAALRGVGFGWLHPEGVRRKLQALASSWRMPAL